MFHVSAPGHCTNRRTRSPKVSTLLLALALLLAMAVLPGRTPDARAADAASVIGAIDDAVREADRARDAYERARTSGDRTGMSRYERDWKDAEYRLEDARIENLSRESGMSPSRIRDMRQSGMGWGQVAKEAGAHPGSLGLGHSKGKKGSWNRDDDRDLYRDYYRKGRDDNRDGRDHDGKDGKDRHANRDDGDNRQDQGKGGKGGKHGKGRPDDYPDSDKRQGKGKQ